MEEDKLETLSNQMAATFLGLLAAYGASQS